MQLGETDGRRRERLDTQHTAVPVDRRCDVHVQVRIHSARHQTSALYDGHRHPFCLQSCKGWHARPGKETVTSTLRLTASSITLRNGACRLLAHASDDTHPANLGATTSQPNTQTAPTVTATTNPMVDPTN